MKIFQEQRWGDAESYLRQAVDGYARNLETEHFARDEKALESMETITMALDNQQRFEDAERTARQLLGMREELRGRHHVDTLQTATDLGILLAAAEEV